jgi:hypothetical protein
MPIRFQRRITIIPGVLVNLSKGGVSVSVGRKGAPLTTGTRGSRATLGVPGIGWAWTEERRLAKGRASW